MKWGIAALWVGAGGMAALRLAQHDAQVALGWERAWPWMLFALHLAMGLTWQLVTPRRFERLVALPALIVAGLWAWGADDLESMPTSQGATGPDVVIVTLDTFRADHLTPDWTPTLWDLGERGAHFTQAVTTAPLTAPAHASMWTGLAVQDHGLLANGRQLTAESVVPTVHERGYRTGAFLSAHVLDRATGLDAGWDHYDDRWGWRQRLRWWPGLDALKVAPGPRTRRGDATVERARRWLAESDQPALLWVHLYDAHGPYAVPAEFRPDADALERARGADRADLNRRDGQPMGLIDLLHTARPAQQKLSYRAGVRYVDHLVSELLQDLDPDARIVVIGDHGESLDEHDYFFNHGAKLYEPSLAVPFVAVGPGVESSDQLVSVTAVRALVDAWTGGPSPGELTQREVLAYTTGQQARREGPVGEERTSRRAAAVRVDGAKLVVHGDKAPAWFDLRVDPYEETPLSVPDSMDPWLDQLQQALAEAPPELSEAERRKLEALGYME